MSGWRPSPALKVVIAIVVIGAAMLCASRGTVSVMRDICAVHRMEALQAGYAAGWWQGYQDGIDCCKRQAAKAAKAARRRERER